MHKDNNNLSKIAKYFLNRFFMLFDILENIFFELVKAQSFSNIQQKSFENFEALLYRMIYIEGETLLFQLE